MKILHVLNPKIPFDHVYREGSSNISLKLISHLKGKTENTVMMNIKGASEDELEEFKRVNGVDIIAADPLIEGRVQYQKPVFEYIRSIANDFDIIQMQQALSTTPGNTLKYLKDVDTPVLFINHTPPEIRAISFMSKDAFVEFSKTKNRYLVAVSNSMRSRLNKVLGIPESTIHTVVNGVIPCDKDPKPFSERTYDFIVLGRIDPIKNIHLSLQFCLEHSPASKILYIGDAFADNYKNGKDTYAEEVYEILESNKDRITHIKSAKPEEVYEYMRDSKVYVHLSPHESAPLATLEAMICGTPALGLNENGVGEFIHKGISGYSLDVIPKSRWSTRFTQLSELADKCLELDPMEVKRHTEKFYSVDAMVNGYLELYNTVTGGKV